MIVGWSGWVDESGWPITVPIVMEHCAIRYQGANVSVFYQGPGAADSCAAAASGWYATSGPPLGSLACYQTRFFGLSWKVYDTGFMLLAAQVCDQLTSGGSASRGTPYQVVPSPPPTPVPTPTENPEQRALRETQQAIDQRADQVSGSLGDLGSALDDYESMIGDMESDASDARTALAKMQSDYRDSFSVELAKRPMNDDQRYNVWSALDDLDSDFYDVDTSTEAVGWDDIHEYRSDATALIDKVSGQIAELDAMSSAHPTLRFSITPAAASSSLAELRSRLADLDVRHDATSAGASDLKMQGQQLLDKAKAEAKKVGVDY